MSDEKKKSEKSMLVKILGGLAVAGVIAYNGWVAWYNAEGSVRSTTKELLTELIPQSLDEEVVEFLEVENFKIDSTAKHKWAGEANAKVKVKESGKTGNIRFTFDVEEKKEDKGEMVYVQNLLVDEVSAAKLLRDEVLCEDVTKAKVDGFLGASKPEIKDWVAYVNDMKEKAQKVTTFQEPELRKEEEGRAVEIVFEVSDVSKTVEYDDGERVDVAVIFSECQTTRGEIWRFGVLVPNVKNTAVTYQKALRLTKGARVRAFGVIYYIDEGFPNGILLSAHLSTPSIVATKLEVIEDGL